MVKAALSWIWNSLNLLFRFDDHYPSGHWLQSFLIFCRLYMKCLRYSWLMFWNLLHEPFCLLMKFQRIVLDTQKLVSTVWFQNSHINLFCSKAKALKKTKSTALDIQKLLSLVELLVLNASSLKQNRFRWKLRNKIGCILFYFPYCFSCITQIVHQNLCITRETRITKIMKIFINHFSLSMFLSLIHIKK